MNLEEKVKKRKESNLEIIEKLKVLVENLPEQRFGQIIANYVFPNYRSKDFFFEESTDTLNHLEELFKESEVEE